MKMLEKDLDNDEISKAVDRFIRGERNRRLVKRNIIDGIHYEALAEEFGLSVSQVKRIIYDSMKMLQK
jgi:AraC-like DNA-binding protein